MKKLVLGYGSVLLVFLCSTPGFSQSCPPTQIAFNIDFEAPTRKTSGKILVKSAEYCGKQYPVNKFILQDVSSQQYGDGTNTIYSELKKNFKFGVESLIFYPGSVSFKNKKVIHGTPQVVRGPVWSGIGWAENAPVITPPPPPLVISAASAFDYDSAVLKPDGQKAVLEFAAKAKGLTTEVNGYASKDTNDNTRVDHNLKLSQARADAVTALLKSNGVNVSKSLGHGETGWGQKFADPASVKLSQRIVRVSPVTIQGK